jgi:hypothetical protein
MFADITSVVAITIAVWALGWQIKDACRSEPVIGVKLTQEYDRRHAVDHLTITAVNWGRSDVTITARGLRLFNGQVLDSEKFHWVGMPDITAVRIEGHSSADWWLWPEEVSAWCD